MAIDWEQLPIFPKQTRKHGPFTPNHRPKSTHYLVATVTKCILDTERYMKVVQKEVANVSNPIARIVPSTVAVVVSGTAMGFTLPEN